MNKIQITPNKNNDFMTTKKRMKEITFIENDINQRGEQRVSEIIFFACIYQTKVKKDGKNKKVNYSSAEKLVKGYRPITPKPPKPPKPPIKKQ